MIPSLFQAFKKVERGRKIHEKKKKKTRGD